MYEIDNVKFGIFLSQLRKEKGFTQKDLAEKLFISDKAVSKWERGASMPDVTLIIPISEVFGVTATELLQGEFIREPQRMTSVEVEKIVTSAISLVTKKDEKIQNHKRKQRTGLFISCSVFVAAEILMLILLGYSTEEIVNNLFLVELLFFIFGAWLCIFAKETLPKYYDENKISSYSDGIFRMNMAGLSFNNSNWKPILATMRTWILVVFVIFPMIYLIGDKLLGENWNNIRNYVVLIDVVVLFIPAYVVGKKYE